MESRRMGNLPILETRSRGVGGEQCPRKAAQTVRFPGHKVEKLPVK
jgi:hypothetical protein